MTVTNKGRLTPTDGPYLDSSGNAPVLAGYFQKKTPAGVRLITLVAGVGYFARVESLPIVAVTPLFWRRCLGG